tara:strand:+ start:347 stop:1036 length:690 start_codon:yes stop_codon:yes gene_type:complete
MIDKLRLDKIGNKFPMYVFIFFTLYFLLRNHLIIVAILFAILYYFNRETILTLLDKHEGDKIVTVKRDDGVKKTTLLRVSDVRDIFSRLKSFRRYNRTSYRRGLKMWNMFQSECQELARVDVLYGNNMFDNAKRYLHKSIVAFDEIQFSIPEQGSAPVLRNSVNTSLRLKSELSDLVQELYRIGYRILIPISDKLNTQFRENPSIYMNQIVIDSSYTRPSNDIDIHTLY